MLLPYRAKNPPESFPFVTIGLIAVNTVIYLLTSDDGLSIRPEIVQEYAVSHNTLSLSRLVTAMFLHAEPFHLLGNMLFLWLFGASVEGRLRPLRFLVVYFAAGILGGLLNDLVLGLMEPAEFGLGASGAIMGVAGAYLYMFPYSCIRVFWWFWYRLGVAEWQARWVILFYVAFDVFYGVLLRGMDGVAHFAHLGGFAAGFGLAALLRGKRDTPDYSEAQAMRTDFQGDLTMLNYNQLEALMAHPGENVPLMMAFLRKATTSQGANGLDLAHTTLRDHLRLLMQRADPAELGRAAVVIPPAIGNLSQGDYLLLGSRAEGVGAYDVAGRLFQRSYELNKQSVDAEMALFRFARLVEQYSSNKAPGAAAYQELLRTFPHGEMAFQARQGLQRLGSNRTQAGSGYVA